MSSDPTTVPPSVAGGHPDTATTGAAVLATGGDAVDAACAMVLAGCVTESIFTGLAGGGFAAVYRAADRSVHLLDFFVAVPGLDGTTAAEPAVVSVSFNGIQVPYTAGGATVAVPGTPFGVAELHRRFGRLPWAEVVQPAVDLAARGTAMPAAHARLLPDIADAMLLGAGGDIYRPGGVMAVGGTIIHHPGLAGTMAAYRDLGEGLFRGGPWRDRFVAEIRAAGGNLSRLDLDGYRVRDLEPARVPFGDGNLVQVRGNDLDGFATSLAALDAGSYRRGGLDRARALVSALRAPSRRTETSSVVAVDAAGNACAVTHSLGLASGVWVDGVHANSMLGEGELLHGERRPGARMSSMMVPHVVTDAQGRLVGTGGAAGGSRIRPALVQVLARHLLDGQDPQSAVDAPRLNVAGNAVHLEPGFEPGVAEGLEADGNEVVAWPEAAPFFGGVSWIGLPGPAADPRRDGLALRV